MTRWAANGQTHDDLLSDSRVSDYEFGKSQAKRHVVDVTLQGLEDANGGMIFAVITGRDVHDHSVAGKQTEPSWVWCTAIRVLDFDQLVHVSRSLEPRNKEEVIRGSKELSTAQSPHR